MSFRELAAAALSSVQNVFGENAAYLQKDALTPVSITASFDEIFEPVNPETQTSVASKQFTALVTLAELPAGSPKKGDKITRTRDSVQFKVIESEPDGLGSSLIYLHRV